MVATRYTSGSKGRRRPRRASSSPGEGTLKGLKIGQAAKIIGVPAYVLRFWETQFPLLRPAHTPSRHRVYQPKDLEVLKLIKRLLYQEGFTIAGARKRLKELGWPREEVGLKENSSEPVAGEQSELLARLNSLKEGLLDLKRELLSIHQMLEH